MRAPSISRFNANDCNTIDDRSGFKVKLSDTMTEWDGYQVTGEMFEERNPQDLPVTPRGNHVFELSRGQSSIIEYTPPDPVKDLSQ